MNKKLSTQPYKGVRDFFPEDMAIQQYIFDTWSKTAESFGYKRYDASVLEPSDLYRSKGAVNEEMVNDQTYTFTDRGEREVTLRPEMTPTVARMIATKQREMAFPVRWYSIPNLFRYERTQKGRLREHWQLNCDMFGSNDIASDVEMIALAHQLLLDFGATPEMFEIRINDRQLMERLYKSLGLNSDLIPAVTRLNDSKNKISAEEYRNKLNEITGDDVLSEEILMMLDKSDEQTDVMVGLSEIGITNVVFDKTLARGFDYYTGTIFEIFDTSGENNRSLLGGGRYDNLTTLFDNEPVSGIGFGMGDVTMRDFLETHDLLNNIEDKISLTLIPLDNTLNLEAFKIARIFRDQEINTVVDISTKKVGKKISSASDSGSGFVIVIGEDEISTNEHTIKNLKTGEETTGTLEDLITVIHKG